MTKFLATGFALVLLLMSHRVFSQSIDEIIASSYESPDEFDQLADLSGNVIRHELDILLTKKQALALNVLKSTESQKDDPRVKRKRRKAIRDVNYRWTRKEIPYTVESNVFSDSERYQIDEAINEWQRYTCLRFRQANRNDDNKIHFDDGRGCYSYVGMTRTGSQKIGLAKGCRFKGVVIHEIGHAVGFHHEQNRPDRDDYIRVIRENIPTKIYYNFEKYPTSAVDSMSVPYDYSSVMHYGSRAFSMNGRDTIRTVNPKDQGKIGNRKGLSFNDIWLANLMYKCNAHCEKKLVCPRGAFQGKNCECWCPGYPYKECSSTGTIPTTTGATTVKTTPKKCGDENTSCRAWANAGYCTRNTYVKTYCKESCGFCSHVEATTASNCVDYNDNCQGWSERGFCKGDYEDIMSDVCPKTCESCHQHRDGTNEDGGNGAVPGLTKGPLLAVALGSSIAVVIKRFI